MRVPNAAGSVEGQIRLKWVCEHHFRMSDESFIGARRLVDTSSGTLLPQKFNAENFISGKH